MPFLLLGLRILGARLMPDNSSVAHLDPVVDARFLSYEVAEALKSIIGVTEVTVGLPTHDLLPVSSIGKASLFLNGPLTDLFNGFEINRLDFHDALMHLPLDLGIHLEQLKEGYCFICNDLVLVIQCIYQHLNIIEIKANHVAWEL